MTGDQRVLVGASLHTQCSVLATRRPVSSPSHLNLRDAITHDIAELVLSGGRVLGHGALGDRGADNSAKACAVRLLDRILFRGVGALVRDSDTRQLAT